MGTWMGTRSCGVVIWAYIGLGFGISKTVSYLGSTYTGGWVVSVSKCVSFHVPILFFLIHMTLTRATRSARSAAESRLISFKISGTVLAR